MGTSATSVMTTPTTTFTTIPTTAHIGAAQTLSNDPYRAELTLQRVLEDPAVIVTPGDRGVPVTPSGGRRFVALRFGVVNTGGTPLNDNGQEHETNLTPLIVTSDDQLLNSVAAEVSGCPPMTGLQLEPGGSATVCSVFQPSSGADVVYVSIGMATGIGDTTVNWRIP
jgi:hypothetical protein